MTSLPSSCPFPPPLLLSLPSPLLFCVRSSTSTRVLAPAPTPLPSLFTSPFPSPTPTWLPPRYNSRVQTPGLANGAVECLQAPPPICRDNVPFRMKVPAVRQRRIVAKTCYFRPFRQLLRLVGALCTSDGELLGDGIHISANLTIHRHSERKE